MPSWEDAQTVLWRGAHIMRNSSLQLTARTDCQPCESAILEAYPPVPVKPSDETAAAVEPEANHLAELPRNP